MIGRQRVFTGWLTRTLEPGVWCPHAVGMPTRIVPCTHTRMIDVQSRVALSPALVS